MHPGESVVLLGANGAGKTTLLKVLLGLMPAWHGAVRLGADDITALRTDQRVRLGHCLHVGARRVPRPDASRRTCASAASSPSGRCCVAGWRNCSAVFPDLAGRKRALAGALSGGQRKMLGIAKALAAGPTLLVMDEPSAGLSPLFVQQVIAVLGRFRAGGAAGGAGLAMLIAEQNVAFLDLADRVYTLEGGRIRFEGTVAQLHADDALHRAYFGLA